MLRLILFVVLVSGSANADTVVATRTIRAQTILSAADLAINPGDIAGAATNLEQLIGQETRVALYAGRPVRPADVGPPAVIERNQIVPLVYALNGLRISTEGRSLMRAGPDERVRVMNLSSRTTVSGRVLPDGTVIVSQ